MNDNRITIEEQESMGLVRRSGGNFVAPLRGEVLPPQRQAPVVIDPYAATIPVTVQQITKYEMDPITRAKAMTMKVHTITIFFAILTAALMYMYSDEFVFLAWLALASLEWIGVFVFLAIVDYRETPAAQNRTQMEAYLKMMSKEQDHRLRHIYPDQYNERRKRK